MKLKLLVISFFIVSLLKGQSTFEEKVTSVSNVRLAVTNAGTFGNAFRGYRDGSSKESTEFPAGSGVEHLFESGVWIGAIRNGQALVSTAAVDAPQGYITGGLGFEFTAEPGTELAERSSFRDSPFYTPSAVSQQDYVAQFTDRFQQIPGTSILINGHTNPLFVDVTLKTYNFNFAFSDFVVFVDIEFINRGNPNGGPNILDSLHFGLWANTVVRNINITPPGSGGAAFYNKGGNGYIDSLQMAYCYDHSGDVGFTNSYIGQKFLGAEDKAGFHHPSVDSTFFAHYSPWEFNNPNAVIWRQTPSNDNERYNKLTNGINDDPCWTMDNGVCGGGTFQQQLNRAGNRSDLVSVGPFRDFRTGDTITLAYAFILAPKLDDGQPYTDNTPEQQEQFRANANRAQTAYNGEDLNFNGILDPEEDKDRNGEITRFILPSPPDIPQTKVIVGKNQVELFWTDSSEFSVDPISQTQDFEGYRIYLTKLGFDVTGVSNLLRDLIPIAEFDEAGNQIANDIGLDAIELSESKLDSLRRSYPDEFENDKLPYSYYYKVDGLLNGWQYAIGLSAFDTGDEEENLDPLESSLLANNFRVFPGAKANPDVKENEPYAYPDPYYLGASWEGRSNFQEQSRKLIFSNLPARCKIQIFTPAGDLIDEIMHDQTYSGQDIRWFNTFADEDGNNKFSGGEHAWDLLSSFTQIISRGIYIFAVEDLESGEVRKGKFTIIK